MKKAVIPNSIPKKPPVSPQKQTAPQNQSIKAKKPAYRFAGKESLAEIIGRAFPKQLIPTKKMGAIFGFLFLLALLLAVFTFPLDSLISGSEGVSIAIGYPYPFLDFGLSDIEKSPIRIGGLAIDLLLYLFISYTIDIVITAILKNSLFESKEEAKRHPVIFKDQGPKAASETIIKKVFQEPIKKSPIKPTKKAPLQKKVPESNPKPYQNPST